MGPIEIGKAIDTYGIGVITVICLGLICWLVRHLIKEQGKTNKSILSMFKVELKALHKDGLTNARLTRKSVRTICTLTEYMNLHFNGSPDKLNFRKKIKP